jgi:hypothetical protein
VDDAELWASVKFLLPARASATFADMVKAPGRKPVRRDDGRSNKTLAEARDGADSVLPPKKPPAPSAKHA